MRKIINWFKDNRDTIVRNSFLIPILLVVIMSISHVVSWYDLGNPFSWAVYLSVAIEIFALASVSAASINVSRASIWFLFGLVTFIQIVGNVFFEYQDINVNDPGFLSWVELIQPAFTDWDLIDHRRLLALIQGGTLPLMSLTALHYYIKFTDKQKVKEEDTGEVVEVVAEEPEITLEESQDKFRSAVEEAQEEVVEDEIELVEEFTEAEADEELDEMLSELEDTNEGVVEIEPVALETEENTELTENLEELSDNEVKEEDQPVDIETLNESDDEDQDEGDSFGPPHVNNGNIS